MNNHMNDYEKRLLTKALRVLYELVGQLDPSGPANPEPSQELEPPVEIDNTTLRRWMAEIGWERQSERGFLPISLSCPHCGKIVQLDMRLIQNSD